MRAPPACAQIIHKTHYKQTNKVSKRSKVQIQHDGMQMIQREGHPLTAFPNLPERLHLLKIYKRGPYACYNLFAKINDMTYILKRKNSAT